MTNGLPFAILLVDDDEDDRYMIDDAFLDISYGREIKKFKNGDGLFHYLDNVEPSLYPTLIVLDNHLGADDATDIITRIKNEPAYRKIQLVVYSGILSPSRKKELLALGVDACFEKGASLDDIRQLATELKNRAQKIKQQ